MQSLPLPRLGSFGLALLASAWTGTAVAAAPEAAADDGLSAHLAAMPRPWTKRIHRLTLAEYQATLEYWAAKYPALLHLELRGKSTAEALRRLPPPPP